MYSVCHICNSYRFHRHTRRVGLLAQMGSDTVGEFKEVLHRPSKLGGQLDKLAPTYIFGASVFSTRI